MKRGMNTIALLAFILLSIEPARAASTNPPFAATCQDVLTHVYRDETDVLGNPMGEKWSTDEHFNIIWKFIYEGGDHIIVGGKRAQIIAQHPGVLIVLETSGGQQGSGFASGVWSYAIHLVMKRIVASQVNAFGTRDSPDHGVKSRSVNLKCTFTFHATQLTSSAANWQDIVKQAQTRLKMFRFYQGPVNGML